MMFGSLIIVCLLPGGEAPADSRAVIEAMKPLGGLIGSWRGTATPLDRQSRKNRAFWRETSKWEWTLSPKRVGLVWTITESKSLREVFITWDAKAQCFRGILKRIGGAELELAGSWREGRLELEGTASDASVVRLTVRPINQDRFTYALAHRPKGSASFIRDLDTGNTREGVRLASSSTGPECIVTGGRGVLTVSHAGKSYYVCCNGCKEAFEAEPEKYIAAPKGKTTPDR